MARAIITDKLSKQYRLGELYRTVLLREALVESAKRLLMNRRTNHETIWALSDVSFEAQAGEVIGIIGRNGAGKSTLLKVLSRITYPTSGWMRIGGRVASLLEVGTGFHDELTGRENIYLNGSIMGMKKREIDAKMDSIVAFADVERFLDTPVKRYSSGMRLRLGFAVAAHLEPDVLLVDEVLAVGDAGFQKKCLGAMDNLHMGGRTVLFVSHNLAAVEHLCPRVIWIDNGRVRMDGDSRTVIQAYQSTFAEAQGSGTDLSAVERRKGSGELQCTRLEFLDTDGKPLGVVRSGVSLVIRLHYRALKQVHEPHFGIEVYTSMGTLITSINTWTAGYNIGALYPGEGYVDVHVESLNLNPDRYYISLWLASVGPRYYDQLDLCTTLDVEAADVNNSGRLMSKSFGIVFLPCHWRHDGFKPSHSHALVLKGSEAS